MGQSNSSLAINLVWFKRDLRTVDHLPLHFALAAGPTAAVFFYEPEWRESPEFDQRQWQFAIQSLLEALGFRIGRDYPEPIVDHKASYLRARERIFKWRRLPEVRALAKKVYERHGSRGQNRRPDRAKI